MWADTSAVLGSEASFTPHCAQAWRGVRQREASLSPPYSLLLAFRNTFAVGLLLGCLPVKDHMPPPCHTLLSRLLTIPLPRCRKLPTDALGQTNSIAGSSLNGPQSHSGRKPLHHISILAVAIVVSDRVIPSPTLCPISQTKRMIRRTLVYQTRLSGKPRVPV